MGMLRKTFLQILAAEKILQGRNCPTTLIPLAIKWFVSKQHLWNTVQFRNKPRWLIVFKGPF